jgi:hypothetical protein
VRHLAHSYFPGGQCGLLFPVAPLHCLSPGPGAANAVGSDAANAANARRTTIVLFLFVTVSPPLPWPQLLRRRRGRTYSFAISVTSRPARPSAAARRVKLVQVADPWPQGVPHLPTSGAFGPLTFPRHLEDGHDASPTAISRSSWRERPESSTHHVCNLTRCDDELVFCHPERGTVYRAEPCVHVLSRSIPLAAPLEPLAPHVHAGDDPPLAARPHRELQRIVAAALAVLLGCRRGDPCERAFGARFVNDRA